MNLTKVINGIIVMGAVTLVSCASHPTNEVKTTKNVSTGQAETYPEAQRKAEVATLDTSATQDRLATQPTGSDLTADNQSMNQTDTDLTAAIRRNIMKEDGLSTSAKNVKIISAQGKVTLRGGVNSAAEKTKVFSLAQKVAGVRSVSNELEVKSGE